MTPAQLAQFKKLLIEAGDSLTLSDFNEKFALVLEIIKKIKDTNEEDRGKLQKKYDNLTEIVDKFYKAADGNLEETKKKALAYCVANCSQESVDLVKVETEKMKAKIDKRISEIRNGVDGKQGPQGIQGRPGKDGSPDTAQMIANKLNKEEEIIDQSVIKGLKEELKQLRSLLSQRSSYVGGGGGTNQVYVYDLSSQLNGVLTSFNLPAMKKVWKVELSSRPVLTQTTHWTIDYANHTLAFTSEIDATTELKAGQICTIYYTA